MATIDIRSDKIEQNVGDPWGRTPHLMADDEEPDGAFVLYIPTRNGLWKMTAVEDIATAIEIVNNEKEANHVQDCEEGDE